MSEQKDARTRRLRHINCQDFWDQIQLQANDELTILIQTLLHEHNHEKWIYTTTGELCGANMVSFHYIILFQICIFSCLIRKKVLKRYFTTAEKHREAKSGWSQHNGNDYKETAKLAKANNTLGATFLDSPRIDA